MLPPAPTGLEDRAPHAQLAKLHDLYAALLQGSHLIGPVYSPRVAARVNDYDVKIAKANGEHVWHVHDATDEFFQVLDGQLDISLRDADGIETTVALRQGDVFVVPKGLMHKPSSPGCSVLMFEPSGTSGTGDQHEGEIPAHVDITTGHELT